ncbi:MAG TPA: hypothetical protein H9899_07015 [Candidatus Sphingomonas excrementigallinarum]|nr:hypothetical protein [Candidatus Sphingomonas excrementigallinarum]
MIHHETISANHASEMDGQGHFNVIESDGEFKVIAGDGGMTINAHDTLADAIKEAQLWADDYDADHEAAMSKRSMEANPLWASFG